jgi:two-component system OmpR family sensor kinase
MSEGRRSERLTTRLMRRLVWIAVAVLIGNIAFVAAYDASDREALLADVVNRQIQALDRAVMASPLTPPVIDPTGLTLFEDFPDAYGYAILDLQGRVVDGRNEGLIPQPLLDSPVAAGDWVARQRASNETVAFASHVVRRPEGDYRVYFAIVDDPANLIGGEIWDEFIGHVWLPLLPTVVLLIGGSLLILKRDLRPVADAAAWARSIRPGNPVIPFQQDNSPAEIEDLTAAVKRAVVRLNTELDSEKRRAAEAAHALRTPVAVLVARLDGLPEDPSLSQLRDDVKALSRTVTQFLLSSGADRMEIGDTDRIELNHIAEETVKKLTPFAVFSGSEIVFTRDTTERIVRGAAEGVELALTNLIENAVFHGGGPIEVAVGPGSVISVSDSGPGLPEGSEQQMFQPFWRGAQAPKGGAGLGLAIVKRIQNAHGGRVDAYKDPVKGTVFKLIFPE